MKRLLTILLVLALVGCEQQTEEQKSELNILWLVIEDFSPDLSCYGNTDLHTPNIDQIAQEGTVYTHAFTSAPVCSPSRSAFMTGMYQTTIGAHHHRSHRGDGFTLPDSVKTAPEWFAQYGYFTANIKHGFDNFKGTGKKDLNFDHGELFQSKHWDSLKTNQPFYAQVNFAPVHRMLYKMPDTLLVDPDSVHLPPYYPDHPVARLDWAQYLTKAMLLDNMVGEVMQKLKRDGLDKNTIVMLFGDHGRNHIRGKQWLYDPGLHIPLIIKKPNQKGGSVSDQMISGIDLLPTSLGLAGLDIPSAMQGNNFMDADPRDYIYAARDRCDESDERVRAVRGKRYKYIRNYKPELPYMQPNKYKQAYYPMWMLMQELADKGQLNQDQLKFLQPGKPVEELYDVIADPHELHNLASSAEHIATLNKMRDLLDDWVIDTRDQGQFSESDSARTMWLKKIAEWDVTSQIGKIRKLIHSYE
ncbi:MAG: sulfatase [Cyclobacteriaceae bacterium]